ncbi:carboxynorspermidine decarboxylase [Spirochaeta dissipatitropha]
MARTVPALIDPARVPSPSFVVDRAALEDNLKILSAVQEKSGAKILLALKAFAMHSVFPQIRQHLPGVCASGPYEARLGRELFCCPDGEVHTFAAAYSEQDLEEVLLLSDHVVFNSCGQWQRFRTRCLEYAETRRDEGRPIHFGLRINPEHSEGTVPIYDPCGPHSRLGIVESELRSFCASDADALRGISGFHMHTLCEQGSDALQRTLAAFEKRFSDFLPDLDWLNLGGGHHITMPGYDRDLLVNLLRTLRERWDLQVYLEPGEAVAIRTGVLVCSVLDITYNGMPLAILDISATAHMPDVLEMPYRPEIWGAGAPGEKEHVYRLGGMSCLAGDVIGDYSFDRPLEIGDRLVFEDMSHYTMVKTTMFNGVHHPSIVCYSPVDNSVEVIRNFSYEDFRDRLS